MPGQAQFRGLALEQAKGAHKAPASPVVTGTVRCLVLKLELKLPAPAWHVQDDFRQKSVYRRRVEEARLRSQIENLSDEDAERLLAEKVRYLLLFSSAP